MNRVVVMGMFLAALFAVLLAPGSANAQRLELRRPFSSLGHGRLLAQNYGQPPPGYGQPQGYAQPPAGYVQAPVYQPGSPQGFSAARLARADDNQIPRMILSPIVGLVFGVALAYVGGVIGFVAGCGGSGDWGACVGGLTIGAMVGYVIGTPIGVSWASGWFGGLGNYGWAMLGTLAGIAVAFPLMYAVDNVSSVAWLGILPAVGSMIFYEIGGGMREARIRSGTEMAFSPTVIPVMNESHIAGAALGFRLTNF